MHNELLAEINDQPWAILPNALNRLVSQIRAGDFPEAARPAQARQEGAVAVIPVSGPIMSKESMLSRIFGLPTSEGLARQVKALASDSSVGAIVLDMDTPGGTVAGVQEAASEIASVRGQKKVVAVSDHLMASAGYWIGSSADEIVASPSSLTGSIGVIAMHVGMSRALDEAGIDVTVMSAGEYKSEGNQFEPLSDEGRNAMQALIDTYYTEFVKGVAANRDAKPSEVRAGYGQGRVLAAKDALAAGLVDRVESIDQVLSRLTASKRAQTPRRRMAAEIALLEATQPRGYTHE